MLKNYITQVVDAEYLAFGVETKISKGRVFIWVGSEWRTSTKKASEVLSAAADTYNHDVYPIHKRKYV
jgi:hypothetical protein